MIPHIWFLVFVAIAAALGAIIFGKLKKSTARLVIKVMIIGVFVNEVFAIARKISEGNDFLHVWPFYLCSVLAIVVPVIVVFDIKFLKDFAYIASLFAGLGYLLFPGYGFNGEAWTIRIAMGIFMHTFAFLVPIYAIACSEFFPRLKNFWKLLIPMAVCFANCEIGYHLIGQDSLYLRPTGSLNFSFLGIPHAVVMCTIVVVSVALFYLAFHVADKYKNKTHVKAKT